MPDQVVGDAGVDLLADQRIVEQRRAHAYGACTGDDELEISDNAWGKEARLF